MIKLSKTKWVAIAVIAAGGIWYFSGDATTTNIDFQTQNLSRGSIESIVNTAGTISPTVTVQVGSEVSGLISSMSADFNSQVVAGQILARIDDRDILVTLRQREADLEVAKANLVQSKASLVNAEAQLQFARNELERTRSLVERKLVSETDLEKATNTVRSAEASLENAKSSIVSSNASILQREAQLEQTQIDLERTYIRSPVDGVVLNRLVDLGQAVSANQSIPTLFEVAEDLSSMQIETSIDEADIGKLTEGLNVRFKVDAYPQRNFTGVVSQVRKAAESSGGVVSYKVIIAASNPDEILLPGMTANVDIILGSKPDVLRVPNAALRFRPPESAIAQQTTAQAAGANGADDRVVQLVTSLGLTDKQASDVSRIMQAQTQAMQAAGGGNAAAGGGFGGAGGGFDRNAMANIRAKMDNELKLVLTEEQFAAYQAQSSQRGAGRNAGGAGEQPMSPGEIWVKTSNGQVQSVAVRTGLSDAEYTEIVSNSLQAGDAVVVRAALLAP